MSSTRRRTAADSLLWSGATNAAIQLITALFGLWLLRLLQPEDYGRVAALVVFSSVASVLQESGFTAALANKRDATEADYSSVFWANTTIGVAIYAILFAAAPAIARFYSDPVIAPLGRLIFLSFVVSSLGTSARAYLFSHLMVRQTSICQLTAIGVSNAVGVVLAYADYGCWALALMTLTYVATLTVMAWCYAPWHPTLPINLRPAWSMFGFSSKLLAGSIATQLTNNAFGVMLTHYYGPHLAGIFSNARKWHEMAVASISGMVQSVTQPLLVSSANEPAPNATTTSARSMDIEHTFRPLLRFTAMISFPALFGLAIIAPDFIVLLAGQQWAASAAFLSMLCAYGAFMPIITLYTNLVISCQRSAIVMRISIGNCVAVWGGIIGAHSLGGSLQAMVAFYILQGIAWLLVWQHVARSLTRLAWHQALRDVLPFLLTATLVMAATWALTRGLPLSWLRMCLCIAAAAAAYVAILLILRNATLLSAFDYAREKAGLGRKDSQK